MFIKAQDLKVGDVFISHKSYNAHTIVMSKQTCERGVTGGAYYDYDVASGDTHVSSFWFYYDEDVEIIDDPVEKREVINDFLNMLDSLIEPIVLSKQAIMEIYLDKADIQE